MFCPHCGTSNPDGARFCQSCGKELPARRAQPAYEPSVPSSQPQAPSVPAPAPAAPAAKRSKLPLVAAAVVALLAIGAAVWFFVLGGKLPFGGARYYQIDRFVQMSGQDILNELEQNQGLTWDNVGYYEFEEFWTGTPKDNPFGGEAIVAFYNDSASWITREEIADGSSVNVAIVWFDASVPGATYDEQLSNAVQTLGLSDEFYRIGQSYMSSAYGQCTTRDGRPAFWVVGVGDNDNGRTAVFISCSSLEAWGASSYDEVPTAFEFDL